MSRRAVPVRRLQLGNLADGPSRDGLGWNGNWTYVIKAGDTLESIWRRYAYPGQSLHLFADWNQWPTDALPPGSVGRTMVFPHSSIVDTVGTYTGPAVPATHMNPQDEASAKPKPATVPVAVPAPTATATVTPAGPTAKAAEPITLPAAVTAPSTVTTVEPAGPTAETRAWEWRQVVAAAKTLPTPAKIGAGLAVAGLLYALFSPSTETAHAPRYR